MMRPHHLLWLLLCAVSLLTSCQLRLHRTLNQDDLVSCKPRQLIARQLDDSLAVRFDIPGRNVSTVTSCGSVLPGGPQAGRLVLAHLDRDEFDATWKRGRPINVLDSEIWHKMVRILTEELAPHQANVGTLLMLENHEVIAFRPSQGGAKLVSLESRPQGLKIIRTLQEKDLASRIFALGSSLMAKSDNEPVLILTGQSPPLVYFHPAAKRLVFLHAPSDNGSEPSLLGINAGTPAFTFRTAKAIFWSSGLLSTLNNPVSFVARGTNAFLSITNSMLQWRPRGMAGLYPPLAASPGDMNLKDWEARLDAITSGKPRPAELKFLIDGAEFFPSFIQSVQDAKETVDVRVFIFDNDDYSVKMADLLRRKAREGIRVRVMMDELGSLFATTSDPLSPMPAGFKSPGDMEQYLKQDSSMKVRPIANPWLTASHTKTMIVDRRKGWLGGMNLGREYRYDWHDLMVEVTGPFVAQMQSDFSRFWGHAGPGGDLAWLAFKLFPPKDRASKMPLSPNAIPVRPLYTRTFNHEIEKSQLEAIRRAQRRIWIENAYFTDHKFLREIIAARQRGVDVRIILPEKNDSGIIAASQLVVMNDLIQNGIRVFSYPGMTHVKAAIYDGWACLGSANLDRFSLQANYEFNIGFSDPKAVADLEKRLFLADFKKSQELYEIAEVPWTSHLADWLANEL